MGAGLTGDEGGAGGMSGLCGAAYCSKAGLAINTNAFSGYLKTLLLFWSGTLLLFWSLNLSAAEPLLTVTLASTVSTERAGDDWAP